MRKICKIGSQGNLIEEISLRDRRYVFKDRSDAGRLISEKLLKYKGSDSIILSIPSGGVPVAFEMMDSQAFKKLSKAGIKILILVMRKVKINNPIDRFKFHFTFTYPEARKYGLWDSFFSRGVKQLHDLGFLDIVIKGGRRGESQFCTYYRLSQRWKKYGTPEFKRLHKGYAISVHGDYLDSA